MARKRKEQTFYEISALVHAITPEVLSTVQGIAEAHAKLSGVVAEVNSLWVQRAVYEARKQEATRRIDQLLSDGSGAAVFVRSCLKLHFGADSEKLTAFHIKPFRGRKRRRRKAESANPEAPAPSGEPET